jgi:hypothetical protein
LNVFPGQASNAKGSRVTLKAKPSVPVNATPSPVTVNAAPATPSPSPATTPAPLNVSPVPQTTQFQTPTRRPPQNDEDAKIPPKYNNNPFPFLYAIL